MGMCRPRASLTPLLCRNCAHLGSMNRALKISAAQSPVRGNLPGLGHKLSVERLHAAADRRLAAVQAVELGSDHDKLGLSARALRRSMSD